MGSTNLYRYSKINATEFSNCTQFRSIFFSVNHRHGSWNFAGWPGMSIYIAPMNKKRFFQYLRQRVFTLAFEIKKTDRIVRWASSYCLREREELTISKRWQYLSGRWRGVARAKRENRDAGKNKRKYEVDNMHMHVKKRGIRKWKRNKRDTGMRK